MEAKIHRVSLGKLAFLAKELQINQSGHRDLGRVIDKKMQVVVLTFEFHKVGIKVRTNAFEYTPQVIKNNFCKHFATVFRHKDQMDMHVKNAMSASADIL